ncbi:MAG: glutathione S-transferase family protein [Cyanobacteria bacterium P01_A01_bin.135]
MELYQFEMSHYCEKVRFLLDYKGLTYQKTEVTPGIGQLEVYQLSGQRQVPLLKDGAQVIADSTAIARYLETTYPDRPIIPTDAQQRGYCLALEAWADDSLGTNARKVMLGAFGQNPDLRAALLPPETPDFLKGLVGAVPREALDILGTGVGLGPDVIKQARLDIEQSLEALTLLLADRPYLVGDTPTLADFAVAAMTMYIKFPAGGYVAVPTSLQGRGVPGIADNPAYATVFDWRERLYADYRIVGGALPSPGGDDRPTAINID